jgi:hypothetical protein
MCNVVIYSDLDGDPADPAKPVICKFMLVSVEERRYVVLGRVNEFGYHADLVHRFCLDRNIPALWEHRPDLVEVYDDNVKLLGGGWLRLQPSDRTVHLYGRSTAYGRFDRSIASELIMNSEDFRGFTVKDAE